MNKPIVPVLAVALALVGSSSALAANGSLAAGWTRDAYLAAKRLEAHKASQAACEAARGIGPACSRPEVKARVRKT